MGEKSLKPAYKNAKSLEKCEETVFPLNLTTTEYRLKYNVSNTYSELYNKSCSSNNLINLFRTVCLLLAFTNITVNASPSTRDQLQVPGLQFLHANDGNLHSNYRALVTRSRKLSEHNGLNNLVKSILSRKSRTTAATCQQTRGVLYNLAVHAYVKAKAVHNVRVRRFYTYRPNGQNTWGERWRTAYEKLRLLYCQADLHSNLFENETNDIKTAIQSMLSVLQHELIKLGVDFTKASRTSCPAHSSSTGTTPSVVVVQKQFLNRLFGLSKELESICENLQRL